jgi:flagellar biosynthesis/type III secretory pathway protein FliH
MTFREEMARKFPWLYKKDEEKVDISIVVEKYHEGYNKGYEDGYETGYRDGKKVGGEHE